MNGAQDLGGQMGFGPINPFVEEVNFHHEWERRVFALSLAMGASGTWNIDASRHARESIHPANYLTWSYYRIWLAGLETLLVENKLTSRAEMTSGKSEASPKPLKNKLLRANVEKTLNAGGPASRISNQTANFRIGDKVRVLNQHPHHHTRAARYLRGRTGTIITRHGPHVFPDDNARGLGENPQWLYTVKFDARTLWGGREGERGVSTRGSNTTDYVHADLFEPYLEKP